MISVIIPTWNRSKVISRAINSVINQSYTNLEILVCDDGSTDDTKKLVNKISKIDNRVKWVSGRHTGGPAIPRNRGIENAHGEWISFLDSDDIWFKDKLRKQIEYAKYYECDMVSTNGYRIVGDKKILFYPLHESNRRLSFKDLLMDNKSICSSVLVKKEIIEQVGTFPTDDKYIAIEDYLTWLKISTKFIIGYLSEPLIEYTDDPTTTIRSRWTKQSHLKRAVFLYIVNWMIHNFSLTPHFVINFISLFIY